MKKPRCSARIYGRAGTTAEGITCSLTLLKKDKKGDEDRTI